MDKRTTCCINMSNDFIMLFWYAISYAKQVLNDFPPAAIHKCQTYNIFYWTMSNVRQLSWSLPGNMVHENSKRYQGEPGFPLIGVHRDMPCPIHPMIFLTPSPSKPMPPLWGTPHLKMKPLPPPPSPPLPPNDSYKKISKKLETVVNTCILLLKEH